MFFKSLATAQAPNVILRLGRLALRCQDYVKSSWVLSAMVFQLCILSFCLKVSWDQSIPTFA